MLTYHEYRLDKSVGFCENTPAKRDKRAKKNGLPSAAHFLRERYLAVALKFSFRRNCRTNITVA